MNEPSSSNRFDFEIDPERVEDNLREMGERVRQLVQDHRYSKVRVSYKGKQLLPDIPLAIFIGAEAATFWWTGPLRIVLLNLGVGSILTVELVNESDEEVEVGRESFMDGDTEEAEASYRNALRMKPNSAAAHYNLAVLLRVSGRVTEAIEHLQEAAEQSEAPEGEKARALLKKMGVED